MGIEEYIQSIFVSGIIFIYLGFENKVGENMMKYVVRKLADPDRYPEDVDELFAYLHSHGVDDIQRQEIQILYPIYCDECWCAGWLIVDDTTKKDFRKWLVAE